MRAVKRIEKDVITSLKDNGKNSLEDSKRHFKSLEDDTHNTE